MSAPWVVALVLAWGGAGEAPSSAVAPIGVRTAVGGAFRHQAAAASFGTRQATLEGAATAFLEAWREGDVDRIAERMSASGIRLHLGGVGYPVLAPRQARAELAHFRASRSPGVIRVERVDDLGGSPRTGFAELRWETVIDRTSEPLAHTIFVSFALDEDGWRITEIRVL